VKDTDQKQIAEGAFNYFFLFLFIGFQIRRHQKASQSNTRRPEGTRAFHKRIADGCTGVGYLFLLFCLVTAVTSYTNVPRCIILFPQLTYYDTSHLSPLTKMHLVTPILSLLTPPKLVTSILISCFLSHIFIHHNHNHNHNIFPLQDWTLSQDRYDLLGRNYVVVPYRCQEPERRDLLTQVGAGHDLHFVPR